MAQLGNVVSSKGRFQIVEMVEVYLDDTREVVGYVIDGPGADSKWMFPSIEEAMSAIEKLEEKSRPKFRP